MSKYFVIVDGKAIDHRYKKIDKGHYAFYLGEVLVGQVINSGSRLGWGAVSNIRLNEFGPVGGFKNRHYAIEYLLQFNGYRDRGN